MTEVVWVAIISAAAAILGNYVGGWREARNQDKAWHRDQRKAAYAELLLGLDRFHEEADIVHFSNQRRLAPAREDPLYQQTVALARLAMIVRLVGSAQVQKSMNDLMTHCFKAVMPLFTRTPRPRATSGIRQWLTTSGHNTTSSCAPLGKIWA